MNRGRYERVGVVNIGQQIVSQLEDNYRKNSSYWNTLEEQGTDCYRLLLGYRDKVPGVVVDRYGPMIACQLSSEKVELNFEQEFYSWCRSQGYTGVIFNRRTRELKRDTQSSLPHVIQVQEHGVSYFVHTHPRSLDFDLFLDTRLLRESLIQSGLGRSCLNLCAYTGSLGVAAAIGGAKEVWQVDFSRGNLELAVQNWEANRSLLSGSWVRYLAQDIYPVLWQLAQGNLKGRRRHVPHVSLKPRTFELVILDPPAYSKGKFGTVDIVKDYESLVAPLASVVAPGGTAILLNNSIKVSQEEMLDKVDRCFSKRGRTVQQADWVATGQDFEVPGASVKTKILRCRLD